MLLVSLLILTGCAKPSDQANTPATVEASTQLYAGLKKDRPLLRETYLIEKQNIRASSGAAQAAAHRVFTKVNFIGMTRKDVLQMVGDPETISDYGEKVGQGPDAPLVYRFDNGMDGDQWTIEFTNRIVTKVTHTMLD